MLSSSSLSPYSLAIAGPKPSLLQAVAAATGALAPPPSGISDMACDHVWFGLAKKGVIWRVGDGSKIKIWRHSWIPRPVFLKLAGRRRPCRLRWVSQLIDENARSWNESMLRRFFHSHDVVEILKIKLPWRQRDDFVAWHFEKSGFFSVRSAYRIGIELRDLDKGGSATSNSADGSRPIWKKFWSLPALPKVKAFAWKLIHNGLASKVNKKCRRLEPIGTCDICGREDEGDYYAVIRCDHAMNLRAALRDVWPLPAKDKLIYTGPEWLLNIY